MCYSALVKRNLDFLESKYGAVVVRDQIDDYFRTSASSPKTFPSLQDRIYPGYFAPVVSKFGEERKTQLMRYGAHPPEFIPNSNTYATFNARSDNLDSPFWSEAFMRLHGFVVLQGFYEWVAVADLIKAGHISLHEVTKYFEEQIELRRQRVIDSGKVFRLTPTEKKSPVFRKVVIQFTPDDGSDLLVPVIISQNSSRIPKPFHHGFAIVTNDPPPEIAAAGHDRCPVILNIEALEEWITVTNAKRQEMFKLLNTRQRITFVHSLAA